MNQPICTVFPGWQTTGPTGIDFSVFTFWNEDQINSIPERAEQPVAVAGTIRNLRFKLIGTSGNPRSITLFVNGSATLLSVSLDAGDDYGEDLGHDIAVNAGDYVYFHGIDTGIIPNRTGQITCEFDAGDDVTSIYSCIGTKTSRLGSTTAYDAPLSGGQVDANTHIARESIVGCDGTLTAMTIRLERAPGSGTSRTFAIYKNGVRQDGSGGTVDTRVTIADTSRQGLTTFSLPLVGLDLLYLECTASGSPLTSAVSGTTAFVATTPGEFQVCGNPADGHTIGTTEYNMPNGRGGTWVGAASADERYALGSINSFSLQTLYSRVNEPIEEGESLTHTLLINGIETVQTNTIPVGETFKFCLADAVEITSDDTWAMKAIALTTEQTFSTWTFVASPIGSPSGSPSGSEGDPSPPPEPPVREPPSVTTPSPAECPCPPPDGGGNPNPGDPNAPPTGPGPGGGGGGNSGPNLGGEGWATSCVGLGTVNEYDEALPGESMADVRDERIWAEIGFGEFADDDTETATPAYWSFEATMPDPPDAYGGRKGLRMFTVSPITRGMSDDNGNYVGSKVTLQLNDKDRAALRTRLGSESAKYVWEREGILRMASEANRRSGYTLADPRELLRGLTYDIGLNRGFTAQLSLEDRIASQFGAFGPDRQFSSRLLSEGLGCQVRDLIGKPQQWIFGEVSDEGATDFVTGEPNSKGLVPVWLFATIGGEDEYHLAAHECGSVIAVYGSDGGEVPTRVLLDPASYRVEVVTITDTETGDTHTMTHLYFPVGSVPTEAHKAGGVNIAANVCGVMGNDGNTITQLFPIYQAVFELIVLPTQESLTGQYGASPPTWVDGRSMIHTGSFTDAQDFSVERVGADGYLGGFVLGGPANGAVTLRELLRRMSNSGDCWFTWTAAGQLKCVLLDDTADVESTPSLREPARIRAMPTPAFAFEEVENPVIFAYDYDDDKQRYRVPRARVQNERAFIRMGRPRASPQPVEMRCVRDHMTARDVASRRLLRRQYPPAYVKVVEPLDGLDRDPGDIVRITSIEGPGTGYDETPVFIKEITFDPNTRRVTHLCRDLTAIISGFGEWASIDLTWDTATDEQQEEFAFWANDDDLIPTELAPGQEWR